ncbi:MAG: helix-turn-helix transcriptional regulator [Agathobacter sp.]|nr:helix-turn-helix transcriptional regulator [Agathobacter sp.]
MKKENNNITDEVVDYLIELRKEEQMTQQDIADATGMKRANVARIESKKYTPTLDVIRRYAECLGLEVEVSLKKKLEKDETI